MKLRRNLPEIAAYAVVAAVLAAVGRQFLPHGFDRLSALSADFPAGSAVVWAAAMAVAGVLVGALLHQRNWLFHAPAALCFGLAVARCTAPDPRIDRIEPILMGLPGWPWLFVLETVLWAALVALGTWVAARTALRLQKSAGVTPTDPKAACSEPVSDAVWRPADLPADEQMTRAGLRLKREAYLGVAVGEPVPETGEARVARRLTPTVIQWAQGAALLAGLLFVVLLLRSESYKQAVFALWAAFLIAGSLVQGFLPVDMPWRTLFLPAGLGVAVYVVTGLTGAELDRFNPLQRPGLFALPIDYVAVGGLGILMGTRPGGFQDFCWSLTRGLFGAIHRWRTGAAEVMPGRKGSAGRPVPATGAPRGTAPSVSRAQPVAEEASGKKDRGGKKRKKR